MTYPNLKNEGATLLKIATKVHEIKKIKFKTERHDLENILQSLKVHKELYRKKHEGSNKKKHF